MRERERGGGGGTERNKDTERETERDTHRERQRQRDRERQRDRPTDRQTDRDNINTTQIHLNICIWQSSMLACLTQERNKTKTTKLKPSDFV